MFRSRSSRLLAAPLALVLFLTPIAIADQSIEAEARLEDEKRREVKKQDDERASKAAERLEADRLHALANTRDQALSNDPPAPLREHSTSTPALATTPAVGQEHHRQLVETCSTSNCEYIGTRVAPYNSGALCGQTFSNQPDIPQCTDSLSEGTSCWVSKSYITTSNGCGASSEYCYMCNEMDKSSCTNCEPLSLFAVPSVSAAHRHLCMPTSSRRLSFSSSRCPPFHLVACHRSDRQEVP